MGIRDKRDFMAGLTLVAFGLGVLILAQDYPMGTAFRMGPGYFPIVLSVLLIGIGLILTCKSLVSGESAVPKFAWRALVVVTASVVLFGVLVQSLGLLMVTALTVAISRLARPGYPWGETALLAVLISVCCAAVFHFGLKVQMPLLPAGW